MWTNQSKGRKMKDLFSNKELDMLAKIQDNLIIELFSTRDKRYCIEKALKNAYLQGRNKK